MYNTILTPPTFRSPTQGTLSSSADTVVQDLLASDNTLFSASGSMVNVWDLRQ